MSGRGILVYASAENLNYVNSQAAPERFMTEAAWDRYRVCLDEFGRPPEAFFPDVGIQPVSNGGLLAAALFVAEKENYPTAENPWSFLEHLAVSNWCKFSIKAKKNQDYLGRGDKLAASLPFVVSELAELRPSLALVPKTILAHEALASAMKAASPETWFLPVPQFNATVINCHLGKWDDRGRELSQQAADQTLGEWMRRLDGVSKSNAWRYIAWLEERLSTDARQSASAPSEQPDPQASPTQSAPDVDVELAALLHEVEEQADPIEPIQVYGLLVALLQRVREASLEPTTELRAECLAFNFREDHPRDADWGLYFGPMSTLPDDSGQLIQTPSLQAVTPEILYYWSERARESQHPTLRARYGDLTWELPPSIQDARRDPDGARIAIDAALELARRPDTPGMAGRARLTRALQLARLLRDQERVARVRDSMIAFMADTAEDDKAGTWAYCFDQLIGARVQLDAGQEDQIILDLESRLGRLAGADPWGAKIAAVRLATYYRREKRTEDVRRVLLLSGAAFERLAQHAMPLVGAAWMRDIHGLYREYNLSVEAKALDPLLAELDQGARANLKRVEHSVEIPGEIFENIAKAVVAEDLETSIAQVALRYIVDPERAEETVLEIAKEAPLQAMFRQVQLDDRGRPESESGGVSEDLKGRVIAQMGQTIGLEALFLRHAIQVVFEQFSPSADALVAVLDESPVFEDSQLVLVERAMQAYLQEDWATFAHLIIPQLEQAVRTLVVIQGGNHLAPHRGGGMMLRTLDKLLGDPSVEAVFGSKVVSYIRVVLTDPRGLNLRNAICHGYLAAERFGPMMSDRLLHVALVLGQLRATPESREAGLSD